MSPVLYSRSYPRFPLQYPVIFGGAPFVGEGVLTSLSLMGCSVLCDREAVCGSEVRVNILLPDQSSTIPIELGRIRWVHGHQFGVEFLRLPMTTRQRLNGALRIELIHMLARPNTSATLPRSAIQCLPRRS